MKMKWNLVLFFCVFFLFGSSLYFGIPRDKYMAWDLLKEMIPIPGISGQEGQVADYIVDSLESKLSNSVRINRDEMHNVWFTVGDGDTHIMFVAHTDELGLVVTGISEHGLLQVSGKGGFFPEMYEGHAVVVHTNRGPVYGVVSPRSGYLLRDGIEQPFNLKEIRIYLGTDSVKSVEELGIRIGDQITIRKKVVELTEDLLCTRAVDDRAGCAALLAAVMNLDLAAVRGKTVTFAWDVQEETGLIGAAELAKKINPDYVIPVDTFVSSDGPFESKRFAMTPLGKGAVIRAIDSSNIAPYKEWQKIWNIAQKHNIPVQVGNTRGGNDGSVFLAGGATNIPISWPGTYSHSFIEKINRKDLEALTKLISAVVKDFE
ncbi:M42 family metallopeptidase [Acidobacteriota bacterium]